MTSQIDKRHHMWQFFRDRALERDNHACRRCGAKRSGPKRGLHIHHFQSVKTDGMDSLDNIVTLCAKCHRWAEKRSMGEVLAECQPVERRQVPSRLSAAMTFCQQARHTARQGVGA